MRTFNLVKSLSTLVNNITSLPFREGLGLGRLILCLSLVTLGVESAWAWRGARVKVYSEPSNGGWVWVTQTSGNAPSSWEKTEDESEQSNLKISDQTWTFYMYANPKTNYQFKGWATSRETNTISYSGQTNQAVSAKGTKGTSYNEYFYYALFARMTADKSSIAFGAQNVGTDNTADVTITTVHAGDVSASITSGGDNFFISNFTSYSSVNTEETKTIKVHFKPTAAGSYTGNLQITGSNGMTPVNISLSGSAKNSAPITWEPEGQLNGGDMLVAKGGDGQTITYSNYADYFTLETNDDGIQYLRAKEVTTTVTASVTATSTEDASFWGTTSTHQVTITNLTRQEIIWDQVLTRENFTGSSYTKELNAYAVNAKTGEATKQAITYTVDNTNIATVSGSTLTVKGLGKTTITATVAGGTAYLSNTSTKTLNVRNLKDPCPSTDIDADYEGENNKVYEKHTVILDVETPKSLSFRCVKKFSVYAALVVEQFYEGAYHDLTKYDGGLNSYDKDITISNIDRRTTKIRFTSDATTTDAYKIDKPSTKETGAPRYDRNTAVTVTAENSYTFTTTPKSERSASFTIDYSNVPVILSLSKGNTGFSINKEDVGDCGLCGLETITITFSAPTAGDYDDVLTIKDNTGTKTYKTITLSATVKKTPQDLQSWNIKDLNTTDSYLLKAETKQGRTAFHFSVESASPAGIATITNNVIQFTGSGTVTVGGYEEGDDNYDRYDLEPRTITISKVTPTISTKPTATITYGQKLNTVSLNGGAAKVNPFRGQATDHTVAGTFAWTNGEYTVVETGGTTHEYDVIFTPSGDEKELYNNASGKAIVTVNKITPTLTAKNEEDLEVYVNDTQTPKLNLVDYITSYSAESDTHSHTQNRSAITYTCDKSSTGIVTNDKMFYATAPGTYTITATAPATGYYNSQTTTFTIKAINYYYSQAKSIVATNATTGKDGGWASVWQGNQDSASIGDDSWRHEDQTSSPKRLTETTHPYYFRAKVGIGYTFAGWFTSAEATEPEYTKPTYDANFTVTNRDRENPWITRYAKFTPITYTVTFVGNGNTGGSMSDQTFTYDVPQNLTPNGFTRTGWSFTGWKDGNGNTYTEKQSVTNLASTQGAVITMTAQWNQDIYTVTLDSDPYGTGGTAQISVKYNELIPASIEPPMPIDPAYIFLGYYDGDTQYYNADGTAISGKKWPFTEGKTLTAKWQSGDYIKSWDVADSYTAQSNIPYDIAKSFSGRTVAYSIEGTDEGVITIDNTNKYIYANKKGKVMITACPMPSEGYSSFSCDTHEITVVGKEQRISWNQSFSFTTQPDGSIDETVALTAKAIDAITESETGNPIWYSVGNANMAEIIGDATTGYSLHVKSFGTGSTTITAHVDGTEVYESGELKFNIRIYKYGDKCYVDVMTYPTEEQLGLESIFTSYKEEVTITKDIFTGAPTDSLYVQIKRNRNASGHLYISAYAGTDAALSVDYTDGDVNTDYQTYRFNLSLENVDNVKFASKSAFPYIIKDVRVTQKSYLRTDIAQVGQYYPIEAGIYVNESYSKQFTISYSAKHQVMWQITNTSKKDDWNLRIVGHTKRNQSTTDYTNDCKDWGTYTFELSTTHVWLTQEDIKDTITIKTSDGNDAIVIPVHLTVGLGALYQFAGTVDNNWSNKENWYKEGSTSPATSLPDMRNKVEVYAPVRISESVSVYSLAVRANTATAGSVTIAPTGGLTVYNGGVTNPQNLDEYLIIESSQEHQGFFRMSPDASALMTPMPIATTQLATRSTLDEGANDDAVWQYIGTPAKTYDPSSRTLKEGLEFTVDYITWLYEWSEPKGWVDMKNVPQPVMLKPFTGYAITQYGKPVYEFTGQLLNSNVRIQLTCTNEPGMQGDNVIANSYTSPIDVTLVDQTDFEGGNVIQAFYVFNSGSYNQWKEQNKEGDGRGKQSGSLNNYTPGQYIAIPTKSGAALGENELTMIAPMQGFDIYATEKGKTAYFNLNYRKHVWNATNARGQMNQPLRAPKADDTYMPDDVARQYATWDSINAAKQACIDAITHRVRLIAYGENSGNDRVVIIESPLYAKQYENGADAPKMFAETDGLLGLYANEQDCGLMSVNATNSVDGMFVGFRAGSDSEYELSASNVIGQPLRLIDLQTQQMIDLKDSATYTFTAEPNSQDDFRFQIINQDIHTNPTGWGGLGAKAKIWYYKQTLYVSDAAANSTAAIYTADGVTLKQVTFNHNTTISTADMPEGVYTVRVEDSVLKFFVKH